MELCFGADSCILPLLADYAFSRPVPLHCRLDDVGRDQAKALGAHIRRHRIPIQLVVVSPLRRTLETATQAFGTSVPMLAVELIREAHGAHPCDKRSPVSEVSSAPVWMVVVVLWGLLPFAIVAQ
jgi:hypothetical protein